jgi:hypothetical protein
MRTPVFAIFAIRVVKSPKDQDIAVSFWALSIPKPLQRPENYHSFPVSAINSQDLLIGQRSAHLKAKPQFAGEGSWRKVHWRFDVTLDRIHTEIRGTVAAAKWASLSPARFLQHAQQTLRAATWWDHPSPEEFDCSKGVMGTCQEALGV